MRRTPIKVGFDFDGVIAYNPFRIVRPIVATVKRNIFGVKKLRFYYPHNKWQQIFWVILHESSVFPADGIDIFKRLVENGDIEAHLVTARYSFLDDHLTKWLKRQNLYSYFTSINLNKKDEQPHVFKENMIHKYSFRYYVEDNLDIVKYVSQHSPKTEILWIYNLLDRSYSYPYKFPFLGKAMDYIISKNAIKE